MSTNSITLPEYADPLSEANGSQCPRWFAAYTFANHEKKVASELERRELQSFLPLYKSVRRWSDRRQVVTAPLFPGYVFVHLELSERLRVLQVPGVVRLVGFNGQPAAVPAEDVARIREFLGQGSWAEPHPFLTAGRRARVQSGPLAGMEGVILRRKSRTRLVISFELLQRSMAVEVGEEDLRPLYEDTPTIRKEKAR